MFDIARAEELGLIQLMAANPGIDPWAPGTPGQIYPVADDAHHARRTAARASSSIPPSCASYYYSAEADPLSFPLGVGRDGYLTPTTALTKIIWPKKTSLLVSDPVRGPATIPRDSSG